MKLTKQFSLIELLVVITILGILATVVSVNVLDHLGKASGSNLSVRAAGFIIVGHEIHHMNVMKERYLK